MFILSNHVIYFSYILDPVITSTEYGPHLASPSYEVKGTGPPSWVESQRVLRALWNVQMDSELQGAINLSS